MAQLIVRNLDDDIKSALRRLAEQHGRSMEEEVRHILRCAANQVPAAGGLGSRIAARFGGIGLDQPLPELHGEAAAPMSLGG
ncbi:MAG: toxin-antitoxin system [Rhodocyclaceae bacterium]|nr:toxin-antitoxin system [Rhodocyclaceae bacterium]